MPRINKPTRVIIRALTAAVVLASSVTAADQWWRLRNPESIPELFIDMAFGNGRYVGVGQGGMIAYFNPVSGWWLTDRKTREDFVGIKFGNGRFIALATNGLLLGSFDGIDWDTLGNCGSGVKGLATDGLRFAITRSSFGFDQYGCTSPDGVTWSSFRIDGHSVDKPIYYRSNFYCHRFYGASPTTFICHADGSEWNSLYGNDPPDVAWETNIAIEDSTFITAYGRIRVNTNNDSTLQSFRAPQNIGHIVGLASDNWSISSVSDYGAFCTLGDSGSWTPQWFDSSYRYKVNAIIEDRGVLRAFTEGDWISSTNGSTWVSDSSLMTDLRDGNNGMNLVIRTENGLIGVGPNGRIFRKLTDMKWSVYDFNGLTYGAGYHDNLWAVAAKPGKAVVFGEQGLAFASANIDLTAWKKVTLPANVTIYGVVANGDEFIACGDSATTRIVLRSFDGENWTLTRISGNSFSLNGSGARFSMAQGRGITLFAISGGRVSYSYDNIEWHDTAFPNDSALNAVIFEQDRFIAVGNSGLMRTSIDGKNWSCILTPWKINLSAITVVGADIFIGGENGLIASAPVDVLNSSVISIPKTAVQKIFSLVATRNSLFMTLPGETNQTLAFLNPQGRLFKLRHCNGEKSVHMPLSDFAPGLYVVRCTLDGRCLTRPFIKF